MLITVYIYTIYTIHIQATPPTANLEVTLLQAACGSSSTHGPGTHVKLYIHTHVKLYTYALQITHIRTSNYTHTATSITHLQLLVRLSYSY
jgi:hypothetical protein